MNEKEIKYMQRSREDKGGVLGPRFFLLFFAIPLTSYYIYDIILQNPCNYKYISLKYNGSHSHFYKRIINFCHFLVFGVYKTEI